MAASGEEVDPQVEVDGDRLPVQSRGLVFPLPDGNDRGTSEAAESFEHPDVFDLAVFRDY